MDSGRYRGRKQVEYEEYQQFITWYMKKSNIRVLKIKDMVGSRTVIDKKTKERVSASYTSVVDIK